MNKVKIFLATVLAAIVLLVPAGTAMAATGTGDATATIGEVVVSEDPWVGEDVTLTGTIIIEASAGVYPDNWFDIFLFANALAGAEAGVTVLNPNGAAVIDVDIVDEDCDSALIGPVDADVTLTYDWEYTINPTDEGVYTINQYAHGYWAYSFIDMVWFWVDDVDGSGDVYAEATTEFYVQAHHPELYFRLDIPFGCGIVEYGLWGKTGMNKELVAIGTVDGVKYKFVIPEGTTVNKTDGSRPFGLYIKNIDGMNLDATFTQMTFSNPVEVYQADGPMYMDIYGEWYGANWVYVGSFTDVIDNAVVLE